MMIGINLSLSSSWAVGIILRGRCSNNKGISVATECIPVKEKNSAKLYNRGER